MKRPLELLGEKSDLVPSPTGDEIGFKFVDGHLEFHLPRFFEQPDLEDPRRANIFRFYRFFKALETQNLLGKSVWQSPQINDESSRERRILSLLENSLSLIDDFDHNGLATSSQTKLSSKDFGNPQWQKMAEPLMSENVIYHPLFCSTQKTTLENPISTLQVFYLKQIFKSFGLRDPLHPTLVQRIDRLRDRAARQRLLRLAKSQATSSRQKKVVGLLSALEGGDLLSSSGTPELALVRSFDFVWERMLRIHINWSPELTLFDNELRAQIPGFWYELNRDNTDHQSRTFSLKPDILTKFREGRKTKLAILDAKNYIPEFSTVNGQGRVAGLPKSYPVIKQYFYRMLLSREHAPGGSFKLNEIMNIFVFPATERALSGRKFLYSGLLLPETENDPAFTPIHCVWANFDHLADTIAMPDSNIHRELFAEIARYNLKT